MLLSKIISANSYKNNYFAIVFCIFFLSACGVTPEHSKYIPKDISYVVTLNLKNLSEKSKDIQQLFTKDFLELADLQKSSKITFFLQNLSKTGVDLKDRAFIYGDISKEFSQNYLAVSFKLEDERLLDGFLRKMPNRDGMSIQSYAGMRYVFFDKKYILGWVNKVAILVTKTTTTDENALKEQLLKLRDLPEKECLKMNNTQFQKLQIAQFDVATWLNLVALDGQIKNYLRKIPFMQIDLKNNYLTSTTRFEKGDVFTDVKLFNTLSTFGQFKKLFNNKIDKQLMQNIPNQAIAITGLSMNMAEARKFYKDSSLELLLSVFFQVEKISGFSTDALFEMFEGDFFYALQDIATTENANIVKYPYRLGLRIRNKETLDKIILKLKKDGFLIQKGQKFALPQMGISFEYKDNILFLDNAERINTTQKDSIQALNPNLINQLAGLSSFVAYADLSKYKQPIIPNYSFQTIQQAVAFNQMAKELEAAFLQMLPLKDDMAEMKINITFKNNKQNSLQSIIQSLK